MTAELKGTSSKTRTLDPATLAAMLPARTVTAAVPRSAASGKRKARKTPPVAPVDQATVSPRIWAEVRRITGQRGPTGRLPNDVAAHVRVFPNRVEILSVPWKDHPTGHARVVGTSDTGTIRHYRKGREVKD